MHKAFRKSGEYELKISKIYRNRRFIFTLLLLFFLGRLRSSSLQQNEIPFIEGCFMPILFENETAVLDMIDCLVFYALSAISHLCISGSREEAFYKSQIYYMATLISWKMAQPFI